MNEAYKMCFFHVEMSALDIPAKDVIQIAARNGKATEHLVQVKATRLVIKTQNSGVVREGANCSKFLWGTRPELELLTCEEQF